MRTTKVVTITMPPEMAEQAAQLAKKQNRTMSELMREALRRYQQEEEQRPQAAALAELANVIEGLRADAQRARVKMTKREIDAEIAAARRETRAEEPSVSLPQKRKRSRR